MTMGRGFGNSASDSSVITRRGRKGSVYGIAKTGDRLTWSNKTAPVVSCPPDGHLLGRRLSFHLE